jgi:hypothetical protein
LELVPVNLSTSILVGHLDHSIYFRCAQLRLGNGFVKDFGRSVKNYVDYSHVRDSNYCFRSVE